MKIKIQLTIKDIIRSETIESAIVDYCKEDHAIASGVIGSSFSTSGPGGGWSRQHSVSDYARRALSDEYGACYYVDSSDGTMATLEDEDDEDSDIVWTDESVVSIELPSIEDCIHHPRAWREIKKNGPRYGMDSDELESLQDEIDNYDNEGESDD